MTDLLIGFFIVLACLFWWHQRGVKVSALVAVRRYCKRLGLQLLDETVQIYRMRPTRDQRGEWVLRRYFRFEFTSTGSQRYIAHATFVGVILETVDLPPYLPPLEDEPPSSVDPCRPCGMP